MIRIPTGAGFTEISPMPLVEDQANLQYSKMRVLLVEDSILLGESIMESLEGCFGLQFDGVAAKQSEAIALLQQHPFDMLIVDIELAEGNGFEVLKATQVESYQFDRPVYIILTNHAYPQYRLLAKKLDVDYFFDKSMDFDLAIETIEDEARRFTLR
ncbi:MAG TPA: response regulator [Methylophilaceae bacterium]|jgi:DNA-binding NarL/FixJ family response regulator